MTIDEDVTVQLERLRTARNSSLKALVNEALRCGLRVMTEPKRRHEPFRTRSVSLGRLRIASIDNVAEALAIAEGEGFR